RIPDHADPWRPIVLERKVLDERAGELLLLVAYARSDRQRAADPPLVLDEPGRVVLRRRPHRRQAREGHVIDLPERRIRNDVDDGAGGGLLAGRRGEGRPGVLHELVVVEMLVIEAVLDLVLAGARDHAGRLGLRLPAVAPIARLVEAEAAADDA